MDNDTEKESATIVCAACGTNIAADSTFCPKCGIKLDEVPSEEDAFESARKTMEDIDTRKPAPSWLYLVACGVILAVVVAMAFTNGFGIFSVGATNPVGVYTDAVEDFLTLSSVSYEMSLTFNGVTERANGWYILGRDFRSSVFYDERERVSDEAGFMSVPATRRTAIQNGEMAVADGGGEWRMTGDPASEREYLSGLLFPCALFGESSPLTLGNAVGRNRLSEPGYLAVMKTQIRILARSIDLTLSDEAIDHLWQLSERFVDRLLDDIAVRERSFIALDRATEDSQFGTMLVYNFGVDVPAILREYIALIRGASIAPGYSRLRQELEDYAAARAAGSGADEGITMISDELMSAAQESGRLDVTLRVLERSKRLHELTIRGEGFEYSLILRDHNNVTGNTDEIGAYINAAR